MEIIYDEDVLKRFVENAVEASPEPSHPDRQVLGGCHRDRCGCRLGWRIAV